jgi:predicted dehydrogenase
MIKPGSRGQAVSRILIVGAGSIGSRHARILRELYPDMEIAILRHRSCDDAQSKSLGVGHCFTSIEDALGFAPDAAVVANPSPMHLSVAMPLAMAGVHLLIEKPIASSADGVGQLIELCDEQDIRLMTGYNLRFLTTLSTFRTMLLQGRVGEIYSVYAEVGQYLPGWRPDIDYRETVSAQKRLGGGVLLELSHEIDYLLWMFSRPRWVDASLSQQGEFEIDVEDTAQLQLGFERDGGEELVARLDMDFVRKDTTRRCTVTGEIGALRWDGVAGRVEYLQTEGDQWEELLLDQPERDFSYQQELKHFISCVEAGSDPSINGRDGEDVLTVVDAARVSSDTGKTVYL